MACPPELREIRETLRTNIQVFLMNTKNSMSSLQQTQFIKILIADCFKISETYLFHIKLKKNI